MRRVSIIVLNWNGKHLLEKSLPALEEALRGCQSWHEVVVVDNGSRDGSAAFVKENYSQVRVLELGRNAGFIGGNNAGVQAARGDVVVFLNNDIIVERGFLAPMLGHFDDPLVFATTGKILMWEGFRKETGLTRGRFYHGMFIPEHGREEIEEPCHVLYANGSCAAVGRAKFLELGGFDELFAPFYWEDTDLSYKAWKRGWYVVYEPRSIFYHKHEATNRPPTFSSFYIEAAKEKNAVLFIWKNLGLRWILAHLAWFPVRFFGELLRGEFAKVAGLGWALSQIGSCLKGRFRSVRAAGRSDSWILAATGRHEPKRRMREAGTRLRILYVTPYLPVSGLHGGGARMFSLIRELTRRGHAVKVISFLTEEETKHVEALRQICKEVRTVPRPGRWEHHLYARVPTVVDEFHSPEMAEAVAQALSSGAIDIAQFEFIHMSQYARMNGAAARFLTEHELGFYSLLRDVLRYGGPARRLVSLARAVKMLDYEVRVSEKFDGVITLTPRERELLRFFSSRARVVAVPMGVDADSFKPVKEPEDTDMVFVGYYRHRPNVDAVLYLARSILPRVWRERPRARLVVVGGSAPAEVTCLSGDARIEVMGHVADLRPVLARSRVFVAPIFRGTGMRQKLLEAMAMGKAIVATPTACEGIKAEHGRHLLMASGAAMFARRVVDLLNDADFRGELGMNGRMLVAEQYDWKKVAAELEEVYFEAVAARKGRAG